MKFKIFSAILAVVLFTCVCLPAHAANQREENVEFTQEMLEKIYSNNAKIEKYIEMKETMPSTRATGYTLLDIPPIEQENNSYCGPACAKMAADYLNIRDEKGRFYTQSKIAPIIGCTSSTGSYSGDIAAGMNELLESEVYELANTRNADLVSSMVYGIDGDYPMFINVKKLPNYSKPVNSGHFILGVGYTFYTQGGSTLMSDLTYNDPRPGYADQYEITCDEMVEACESKAGNFIRAIP